MKRLGLVSLLVILLAGGAIGAMSTPSVAQGYGGYVYAAPPPNPFSTPWVGPGTPWVYYQGDWFLNGMLYHFYGNQYGWAPYYAYAPTYIVRPYKWYEPKWNVWYKNNPHYWKTFEQKYPYWRGHRLVGVMTRIFTISTIVATGKVGIKASRAVLLALLVMTGINRENMVMKDSISSSRSDASPQIAPAGRSGDF